MGKQQVVVLAVPMEVPTDRLRFIYIITNIRAFCVTQILP